MNLKVSENLTSSQRTTLLFGFLFVALAYMSIKLSVPALPTLQHIFHTDPIYLKLSAALFLVAFSISQLFWGGIAKFMARRNIIFINLTITLVGTVTAMLSTNVETFIIGRFIEGLGMGVASPVCRVLMADTIDRNQIARVSFFFGVIFNFSPFVAPTLGQYIMIVSDWRFVFAFFSVLTAVFYIITYYKLPETITTKVRKVYVGEIFKNYKAVLSSRYFWLYITTIAIYAGTKLGYYMAIPYWFRVHFHISDHYYTLLALWTAMPNLLAYYLGRFSIKKYGTDTTLVAALVFSLFAAICVIVFALLKLATVATYITPLVILAISCGFIQPAVNAGLISRMRDQAGVVGALIPVMPFLVSALVFLLFTNISLSAYWPFALYIVFVVIVSLAVAALIWRMPKKLYDH